MASKSGVLRPPPDQHLFEVLAGAAPGAPVDVATVAVVEAQARPLEDLGVEPAAVVDDNEDGCACAERSCGPLEHRGDAVRVRGHCGAARAGGSCTELALTTIV